MLDRTIRVILINIINHLIKPNFIFQSFRRKEVIVPVGVVGAEDVLAAAKSRTKNYDGCVPA